MFEATTSDQQSQQSVIVVSNNSVVVGSGVTSTTVVNSSSITNDVTSSNSVVVDALNEALADAIHNDGCQRLNILSSYYYCTFQPINHLHHLNLNFNLNNNKHLNTSTSSNYTSSPSSSSTAQTNDSLKFKTNALTKDNLFDKMEQTGFFHDLKQAKEDESTLNSAESLQQQVLNDSNSNAQSINSEKILAKKSLLNDNLNKSKISVRSIHKIKKKRLFLKSKQRSSVSPVSKLKESKSKFRTIFKQSNSYLNRLKNYVLNKNDRSKKRPNSKYDVLTSNKSTETTTVPLQNSTQPLRSHHKRPLLKQQIKTNSYATSIQTTSSDTNSKKRHNFFNRIIKFNRKKRTKLEKIVFEQQPVEQQSIINETSHNLDLTQQMSNNYQTQQFCYDIEMMPPPNNQSQTTTITNQQFFFDQVNNRSSILMSTNSLGIQNQLKQDLLKISFEKFKQFRLNEKLLQQTVLIRNAIKMLQYDIQYQQEQEQLLQQQHQQQQMQQQIMDYSLNDQKQSTSQQTSSITMSTYENLDEFLSRSEFINNNILNVNNSIHNKNITQQQTQINGIGCYFVNIDAQENNNTEYEPNKVLQNDQEPMQIKHYTAESIEDIDVVNNNNNDEDDDLEEDDDEDENDSLEEDTVDDKKFSYNLTDCNNKLDDNTHGTFHSSNELNKFTLFIDNKLETNDTNNNSILTDDAKENFYLNTSDENDDYTIQNDLTSATMNASIFNTDFTKFQQQQQQS